MTSPLRYTSGGDYPLTEEESARIDILKFVSIVLVVYIHAYAVSINFSDGSHDLGLPIWLRIFEEVVSQNIARCGVPLFFFLSAVLLFKRTRLFGETLRSKARTLLLPYILWNTFWIVIFVAFQSLPSTAVFFSQDRILDGALNTWLGYYGIGGNPFAYQFWFLRDLIVVTLFYPFIWIIAAKIPRLALALGFLFLFIPVDFPFKVALQWFILGACVVSLDLRMARIDKLPWALAGGAYIAAGVLAFATEWYWADSLFVVVSMLFLIKASKLIVDSGATKQRFLWMAQWTFIVYAFHELTLTSLKKICLRLLPQDQLFLFAEYALLPVLVIAACVAFGLLSRKLIPKIYAIATGGR